MGKERSYFDGGLLQQIGWTILGNLITAITLVLTDITNVDDIKRC